MSAYAPPPPQLFPNQPTHSWFKIGGIGAVALLVIGTVLLTTGRIPWFGKREAPPEPVAVEVNGKITPVDRPKEDKPAAPDVAPPPAADKLRGPATPADEQKLARMSKLGALNTGHTNNANAATTRPAAKPGGEDGALPPGATGDALEASLVPTRMEGTRVAELPNPRWLVEQGRVLQCTDQTAIDSTLPGGVTAMLKENVRGETADVVLLPKGSRVFGTVQHALVNGLDRLAVLWQNITTTVMYDARNMPHQFRIATNSPASSALGDTGLDGDVDRHLWKKIGGIIGISLIQGTIQAGVQAAGNATQSGRGNTTLNFNSFGQGGSNAADELLRAWINIPDVLHRNQGAPCAIYLMRDLDMHGAYQLQVRM